jgi:cytidylate kinase
MKSTDHLEQYLRAQIEEHHSPRTADGVEPIHRPFVTISRQAGAGGYRLADRLVEVFSEQPESEIFQGWQVFDRKLCEIVASDPGFSKSLDSLLDEEYRSTAADVLHTALRSTLDQNYVMNRVFKVVRALASIGKAIIVGRGGAQVTAHMSPGVRMRLVAPPEERIRGIMNYYELDEKEARVRAKKLDAGRSRLIKAHFDADIDDPTQYDLVWNTATSSIDDIAHAAAALLRTRVLAEQRQ